jgi:hypothetical protein
MQTPEKQGYGMSGFALLVARPYRPNLLMARDSAGKLQSKLAPCCTQGQPDARTAPPESGNWPLRGAVGRPTAPRLACALQDVETPDAGKRRCEEIVEHLSTTEAPRRRGQKRKGIFLCVSVPQWWRWHFLTPSDALATARGMATLAMNSHGQAARATLGLQLRRAASPAPQTAGGHLLVNRHQSS